MLDLAQDDTKIIQLALTDLSQKQRYMYLIRPERKPMYKPLYLDMDPRHSAQDVARCDLCEDTIAQNYCDYCHRELIEKDTEELETIISPTYEEIAADLEAQIANMDGEYGKLTEAVTEHGKEWHKEIDNIIQTRIKQTLLKLIRIDESNEVSMTMEYSSNIRELSTLPSKIKVSLPTFSPKSKDSELLYKLFGSLTPLCTTTEKNGYTLKNSEQSTRELLKESEIITTINTGFDSLRSVSRLSEVEIWTSGMDS
ncbi:uncharacterized protein LOC134234217, partial [Saccostrea cucullata]|uniref:uncharacterized protein LOC134234217 n=1 Tax=Saccostrea cuccullata TaxID=36930 RepID=UPI002ED69B50